MNLEIGRRIADRYIVEGLIGQGAMGAVYAVRHADLGARYAMKVLHVAGDLARVRSIQSRLMTEGRIQATLKHRNVLQVVDTVLVDELPGLVMERIDGPDLDAYLVEHGALPPDEARTLGRDILRGVRAAHRAGHLHRDLKPANILLAREDDELIPKIADFGLAKVLEGDAQQVHSTAIGAMFGTPQYMSPEQALDAKSVDARTDVFALGCILYELVTGRQAFDGRSVLEIQTRVAAGRYKPPEALVPDLPTPMVRAIHGALQPEADARIPDCETLLQVWLGEADFEVQARPRTLAQAFGWASAEVVPDAPGAVRLEGYDAQAETVMPEAVTAVTLVPDSLGPDDLTLPPPIADTLAEQVTPDPGVEPQAPIAEVVVPTGSPRWVGFAMWGLSLVLLVELAFFVLTFGGEYWRITMGLPAPSGASRAVAEQGSDHRRRPRRSASRSIDVDAPSPVGDTPTPTVDAPAPAPRREPAPAPAPPPEPAPAPAPVPTSRPATPAPRTAATPVPAPRPEPIQPTPTPAVPTEPQPAATPPSVGYGRVRLASAKANPLDLSLIGADDQRYPGVGLVPAGDYRIEGRFGGEPVQSLGTVRVVAEENLTLYCEARRGCASRPWPPEAAPSPAPVVAPPAVAPQPTLDICKTDLCAPADRDPVLCEGCP